MPKFNVVLHGLIALHDHGDSIVALLPSLPGIHVQRAGDWIVERELQPRRDYKLSNVRTGAGKFDPERNMVLGKFPLNPHPSIPVHAEILFPRPLEIHSLRLVTIDPATDFAGATAGQIKTTLLSTLQIFVYDCVSSVADVRLDNHNWIPPQDPLLQFGNLHIFSEEEFEVDDHSSKAFDRTAALFAGVDLQLVNSRNVPKIDPLTDIPPQGVSMPELLNLAHRQSRACDTGRQLLSRPLNLLQSLSDIWEDMSGIGSTVRTCSFPIAIAP